MRKYIITALLTGMATHASAGTVTVVANFTDLDNDQAPFVASGSLDITERVEIDSGNDFFSELGFYNVSNNTGGALTGFGVSNNDTLPAIYEDEDGFPSPEGCASIGSYETCYSVRTLNAQNWGSEIAYYGSEQQTFEDIFGAFETVAGDENMFNWFDFTSFEIFVPTLLDEDTFELITDIQDVNVVDAIEFSGLKNGDVLNDFFGFLDGQALSSIIGASSNGNGTSFYTAGQAVAPSAVPLPAAAWMLLAGIGGLGAIARRKKS